MVTMTSIYATSEILYFAPSLRMLSINVHDFPNRYMGPTGSEWLNREDCVGRDTTDWFVIVL